MSIIPKIQVIYCLNLSKNFENKNFLQKTEEE